MNREQLAAALAEGKITQADYDAAIAKLDESEKAGGGSGGNGGLTQEQVQAMIDKASQSAEDRVRTEYAKKLKDAQEEADKLRREKMTEEERAKDELETTKRKLAEQQAELTKREVALHTISSLTDKKLPLEFKDFLSGSDVAETDKRIGAFQAVWSAEIQKHIEEKFKAGGSDPEKGKGSGGNINPFKKETINYTEQGRLINSDPARARILAQEAGVTPDW